MTETKIYCDHCGKVLDTMKDYEDVCIEAAHKWVNADLCVECLDELYEIIWQFCTKKGGVE